MALRATLIGLLLVAACSNPLGVHRVSLSLPYDVLEQAAWGDQQMKGLSVARTPEELAALWKHVHPGLQPEPEPPDVDFDSRMVLAYFMGVRPSTGYSAVVARLTNIDETLCVHMEEWSPGRGCFVGEMMTSPVVVIAPERWDGAIRTRVRQHVRNCG